MPNEDYVPEVEDDSQPCSPNGGLMASDLIIKENKMKRITVDYVMSLSPCYDREWVEDKFDGKKWLSPLTVLKLNTVNAGDKLWLLVREDFLSEKDSRLFACDCAERVLPLFEEKYPDDNRPRKAIETARLFAEGKATEEELADAVAAAGAAAVDAALAARAAAWDDGRAARAAAWDDGRAARAARAAAGAAEAEWQLTRLEQYLRGDVCQPI